MAEKVVWQTGFDNSPYLKVVFHGFVRADGTVGIQSRAEVWDGVVVVAVDDATRKVYMVQQKRDHDGVESITLELPGGGIDAGNTAAQAARKELKEEVGAFGGDTWIRLYGPEGMSPISGLVWTKQHAFLVTGVNQKIDAPPEPGIELVLKSFDELLEIDRQNGFRDPLGPYAIRRAHEWIQMNRPELLR